MNKQISTRSCCKTKSQHSNKILKATWDSQPKSMICGWIKSNS